MAAPAAGLSGESGPPRKASLIPRCAHLRPGWADARSSGYGKHVSALVRTIGDRSFQRVRACAIGGLPAETSAIAAALGLHPAQFGPTRRGAIQADIDLPIGYWRVWPDQGIGLWVGGDPGQAPPLQRWHAPAELDLLQTILRLGEHDVWLYEAQLWEENGWTAPLSLKAIYQGLRRRPNGFAALRGEFGDASGRSQTAFISRTGCVETLSPTQAVRWLSIAYGLNRD
jgi:hypothetical protein